MRWPWQRAERDQRDPAEVDMDAEFKRTRRALLSALDELQVQVERSEYREAARERQQRRAQPGTA